MENIINSGIIYINYHKNSLNQFDILSYLCKLVWFMVFNAIFNNISFISWWSVLLVEETGVPGENDRPVESH